MRQILIAAMAMIVAGCSSVAIEDKDGLLVATATATGFASTTKLAARTLATVKRICTDASGTFRFDQPDVQVLNVGERLAEVEKMLERANSIVAKAVSLFGTLGGEAKYTLTARCEGRT